MEVNKGDVIVKRDELIKTMKKCRCGSVVQWIETDNQTKCTFIECKGCRRAIGGLTIKDAVDMWNGAMAE